MSRLERLSILGVRSFDIVKTESIHFHAPLTLIVGLNGSGKTTIIECLKYATTGDLPPNSKGGAFIHDPKLCGEKEVLAQVKVQFRSTEGTRMVCTRSMQLTVKKASRSMKTLEGNLLMLRDAERVALSSRVAEMDVSHKLITPKTFHNRLTCLLDQTMMPQYLGVSKAVLDSVIFCHQEESLWPLSEPSKLKVRFDEIFEALKYTKAIDNIKVLQKKKREELVGYKKDQDHSKVIKDKADENQKRSTKLSAEIDELRSASEQKSTQIREAARKAEDAWQKAETAGMIVGELNGKRIEQKTKEESVQSLRENLKELSESDAELQRMLEQYEERVQAYEADLNTRKSHYGELGNDIQQARGRVSAKERECGGYEAQQQSYDQQLQNRERLVKETARSHNIRGFDLEVEHQQVEAFIDRISKMARDQNAAFERARNETQEELRRAQSALNKINESKSALSQRKESAKQNTATYDKKIKSLQAELDRVAVDEGSTVVVTSTLQEIETKLRSAKSEQSNADWDKIIEGSEAELRKHEERKDKLDAELVECTRMAGDSARLDFLRKELEDRKRSLEMLTGAHSDKIGSVVGRGWTPASIDADFQRALGHSASLVSEAERQTEGTNRELEQIDFKLNVCYHDLKSSRDTLQTSEAAIRKAMDIEPSDYKKTIKDLEDSRDFTKADVDSFSKVQEYLESCIKMAKEHNGCKTCARTFSSPKELEKMLKVVEKEREKFEGGEDMKQELADFERDLQDAKGVSGDFDAWFRVTQKDIPNLEAEKEKLLDQRTKLTAQLEQQDNVVSERSSENRDVEAMTKTIQNIARYSTEITNFERQTAELAGKQKAAGGSRGLEIVQEETAKVNDAIKTVKSRLAKNTSDRERARTVINSLELEVRDVRSKLSTIEHQLKEKKTLEGNVEEYKGFNVEQRESIKSIDQELQDLGPQLSQAQMKYDDIARRGAEKDRELQNAANKLNNSLSDLKKADEEIKAYVSRGGPGQLVRGRREVEKLKGEVSSIEAEQLRTVREVKQLEDQLRNHSETKRSISDNQRYRRDLRQLEGVRAEIEQLETHNAEADKAHYEREGSKWQMERNKQAAEQATIVGSLKSKDDQLQQYIQDWEVDYQFAARKYKEAHIMVETTKACVEDLGRYGGALDKAIMKYHSIKMEEINRIIEELWRKTYQGTDVDSIIIRSESENVKSNKSYNYRVVMVKSDTEMDMRGRCSAGQKVLASIIIRLALAECFGINCGIIALDEPTTNLDRDNIEALAKSLAEIIRDRRQQKNFQLIVITHDESFLRAMNCSDHADVFWRVSRNERQKSTITKESIANL